MDDEQEARLGALFHDAAADAPPPGFDAQQVVATSRRITRRRQRVLTGSAAVVLVLVGIGGARVLTTDAGGLPLASTTYYFASLDELVVAAVEWSGRAELAEVRAELGTLPAVADLDAVAELVLDQLLGRESRQSPEAVILRYERFVGAGRRPYLTPLMREMRGEFDALLVDVLARAGRSLDDRRLARLVALVDGTVVNSLIEADPDPRAAARAALLAELSP